MSLYLIPGLFHFLQIPLLLITGLLGMLNGLFQASNLGTDLIGAGLNLVEGLGLFAMLLALVLDVGFHIAQYRHLGLEMGLQGLNLFFPLRRVLIEGGPAQGLQLGLYQSFLLLQLLVALGGLSLALQCLKSPLKFIPQIINTI